MIGYRARLPGSVVQRAVRHAPGAASAIGRGVAQLGATALNVTYQTNETNAKIAESQARMARGQAVADGMGRLSELQLSIGQELQDLRDQSQPGAPDHAAKVEEVVRKATDEFLGTLPRDAQVQQQFAPMVTRWATRAIGGERDWERTTRNRYVGQQFETWVDTQAAGLYADPTPDSLQAMLAEGDQAIALQEVPDEAKTAMRELQRRKWVPAMFEGALAQGQTDAVAAAVSSGKFDQWIGGAEGKSRWMNRVGAARDVAAREAEAAAHAQKRDAQDALDTIDARIAAGEAVPQADIETALQAAKAAGVEKARLVKFADAGQRATFAASARTLPTRELNAQVEALNHKRSAGKASAEDLRMLDAADKELDARADKGAQDVTALWKGGLAEKAVAVAQLQAMPAAERYRIAEKVGDNIGVVASLHPRLADITLRGAEIRQQRPGAYMPRAPRSDKGDEKLARAAFNSYLGQALMNDLGPGYDALLNTSLDMFVGSQANMGDSGTWNENEFRKAINNVFGATRRPDGTMQGGLAQVRGHRIELPAGWTGAEFDRSFSRMDFAGAAYGDGSPAQKADVLENYRPVVTRVEEDGAVWYRLDDARGQSLRRAEDTRQVWQLRVSRNANGAKLRKSSSPPQPEVAGNLPLSIRYRVKNQDGSISTVRTMSIGTDGGEVLIPTVINGKVYSEQDAIDHYYKTGENFGVFKSVADANAYAEWLHNKHAKELKAGGR